MDMFHAFGQMATIVQLALVLGSVALIFLFACSRRAGQNLLVFLGGLKSVLWEKGRQSRQRRYSHQKGEKKRM